MRFFSVIFLVVVWSLVAHAQVTGIPDSLARPDTTIRDSLRSKKDTVRTASGIDTLVNYSSSDSIVYDMKSRVMSLYSKGIITYRDMELKADRIDINWNTSVMSAHGVADTSDSTGKKMQGLPIMKDGGETYHGQELGYNFQTKKGKIVVANTTIDQGYYHGEAIKKFEKDVLFVEDGRYTTCDAPEPHYYFFSPKMKVVPGDKIVAEPVFLYIADVPVFALPFGVFPNQRGRRSGIIAPAYGDDGSRGKYLAHLGYYWAMSDYTDVNFLTDLYSKGGWAASSKFQYALRYNLNGSLSVDYKNLHTGEANDPQRTADESYQVHILHNQEIDPKTHLSSDFTFSSDNAYQTTNDINQILNQNITSNATLAHSFDENNSVTLSINRTQDLQNGNIDATLPSVSFNHGSTFPFRWGKRTDSEENLPWYQMISFGYSASMDNRESKASLTVDSVKTMISGRDTLQNVGDFSRTRQQDINQSASLNFAPKFGYITIAPFVSYNDSRTFMNSDVPQLNRTDSTEEILNSRSVTRTGTLSSGIAASTKLFGIVQPGLFGIAALRHTITPRLTLSYNKQVVGDNPTGGQALANFSLGNVFEMKTSGGSGGEDKEGSKIELMTINAGLNYNFSADSLRFSELTTNYYTKIGNFFDVSGDASFNLYKIEMINPTTYNVVNKFLLSEGGVARLTSFHIGLSTSFSGTKKSTPQQAADTLVSKRKLPGMSYNPYEQEDPDFSIPWKLSFAFNYSETKVPPFPTRSVDMNGHLEMNLTENWKLSFQTNYDVLDKQFIAPQINVSRDLHCWIMNFTWVPIGDHRYYQLEIRVKAPQLKDLKVTKSGSENGIY
jgi:hypothetical protein